MPTGNIEDAMLLIEKWMGGRGFAISPEQDKDGATDEFNFKFNSKTDMGLGFAIMQPKNVPRTVIMASRVDIAKPHDDALGSMKTRKFEDFMWELKKELILAPAAFQILPPQGIPKSIQLSREISFDELTEGRLADALGSIMKSAVLIILLFSKKFELGTTGSQKRGN
jgi:hypothetical protein